MSYAYIDSEYALVGYLKSLGYRATIWIPEKPEAPLVAVQKVGGTAAGVIAVDRVQITVLTEGREQGRKLSSRLVPELTEEPIFVPEVGLLDRITVEGTPVEVPFKESYTTHIFTVRVETRAI